MDSFRSVRRSDGSVPVRQAAGYRDRGAALLPTRTRINPANPEGAEYHDPDQHHYVVKNENGRHRSLTTFGDLGEDWAVGTSHRVQHDQTSESLGYHDVVGIRRPDGSTEGEVPDKPIPHYVFK